MINSIIGVGFVSIDDPDNNRTVETSSREGLVETEFFEERRKAGLVEIPSDHARAGREGSLHPRLAP